MSSTRWKVFAPSLCRTSTTFDEPLILFSGVVLHRVHEQLYFLGSFVAFVYSFPAIYAFCVIMGFIWSMSFRALFVDTRWTCDHTLVLRADRTVSTDSPVTHSLLTAVVKPSSVLGVEDSFLGKIWVNKLVFHKNITKYVGSIIRHWLSCEFDSARCVVYTYFYMFVIFLLLRIVGESSFSVFLKVLLRLPYPTRCVFALHEASFWLLPGIDYLFWCSIVRLQTYPRPEI